MPKELNRTEAAKHLGVSPRTLEYWATKKVGPDYRRRGRQTFYRVEDLNRWSDAHQLRRMTPTKSTNAAAVIPTGYTQARNDGQIS